MEATRRSPGRLHAHALLASEPKGGCMRKPLRALAIAAVAALLVAPVGSAHALNADTLVTVGSPSSPFSANKQNEPAVAIDANHPGVLAAGSNDNIDMEACNAGPDNDCPFTEGVGVSGVYFSFNSGTTWFQPTFNGWSARNCTGAVGDADPPCEPQVGPIGTLPGYFEAGLVSDGDPAVAFGPVYRNGSFSWANGSRLYYANLTSNFPGQAGFKGFEAIAVSRIDGPASTGLTQAIVSNQANWQVPVILSKQNAALFSDKEQVWADNAESSPFFGNTYICSAAFRGVPGASQPLVVAPSTNGGIAGPPARSPRPPTTSTAPTASAGQAARSGPTATAWPTCSPTSSPTAPPATASSSCPPRPTAAATGPRHGRSSQRPTCATPSSHPSAAASRTASAAPATTSAPPQAWTSPTAPRPAPTPPTRSSTPGPTAATASTTSTSCSPPPPTAAPPGPLPGPSRRPGTAATTPPQRSRPTGPTSGWCTTPSPPRSATTLPRHGTWSGWSSTPTSAAGAPSAASPRSTAALAGIQGAAARTTWPRSSWAITSMRRPPAPMGPRCGTTSAGPPTAPPSTPTVSRSTTRRYWPVGRWPSRKSHGASKTPSTMR